MKYTSGMSKTYSSCKAYSLKAVPSEFESWNLYWIRKSIHSKKDLICSLLRYVLQKCGKPQNNSWHVDWKDPLGLIAYLQKDVCASPVIRTLPAAALIKSCSWDKQRSATGNEPLDGHVGLQTEPTSDSSQVWVLLSSASSPAHDTLRVVITSTVMSK
jgi:hypothetical protein